MNATVALIHTGDMRCEAQLPGNETVLHIDSIKHRGLADYGGSPLDLLALAHGACTAMLVAMKGGAEQVDTDGMGVEVKHEYDDGPPMRLKGSTIRFTLPLGSTDEQIAKLRAAAAMCPVHTALRSDIEVEMEFVRGK